MTPLSRFCGIAVPLKMSNVDTDQLAPARFLHRKRSEGFADALFHDLRHTAHGDVLTGFPLEDPRFAGAEILLALDNFGCGSSREHAVWALLDFGIRAVIAPNFADIFRNNAYLNGLLPIVLPGNAVWTLIDRAAELAPIRIEIDLPSQRVICGQDQFEFAIDAFRKRALLEGLGEIETTLTERSRIDTFEQALRISSPWLARIPEECRSEPPPAHHLSEHVSHEPQQVSTHHLVDRRG